jgi:pSer/pThr/pTyr-binding forkhead associated (FHA) protein/DNA-directed RNA polymerase subunit RPC12/RpoP
LRARVLDDKPSSNASDDVEERVINCPNCGRDNEDHYKFCLGCGTVLPRPEVKPEAEVSNMIACPHCSSPVPSTNRFCGSCGGAVAAQPAAPPKPAYDPSPPQSVTQPTPVMAATPQVIAHLVVIKPDGSEGARIPLTQDDATLGRSSTHEVLAGDPFLSPEHANFSYSGGTFTVKDLSSLNGVFIRIRGEVELVDGDYIRVGQELLHFHLMANVPPIVEKAPETLTAGSPDTGYWGRLSLISGPDLESRGFVFNGDEVTLGREIGEVLFRDDGFVSGRHARIAKVENKVFIKDLGSSNGTYIRIREAHRVEPGDLILMGQQLFKLVQA